MNSKPLVRHAPTSCYSLVFMFSQIPGATGGKHQVLCLCWAESRTEFETRWRVILKDAAGQFCHHHVEFVQLPGLQRGCPCTQPWSPSLSQPPPGVLITVPAGSGLSFVPLGPTLRVMAQWGSFLWLSLAYWSSLRGAW